MHEQRRHMLDAPPAQDQPQRIQYAGDRPRDESLQKRSQMPSFRLDTMPARILITTRSARNDGRPAPDTVVIAMLRNTGGTRTALPRRLLNKQFTIAPGRIQKLRTRMSVDVIAYAYLSLPDERREAALYHIAHGEPSSSCVLTKGYRRDAVAARVARTGYYTCRSRKMAMRCSMGGCVANRPATKRPVACAPNGLEMNRCAVAAEARSIGAA